MSATLLNNPRRYRHYKGGVYEIVTEARMESTEELVFVYRSVETGEVWVRARSAFDEIVEWNGQSVPRFSEVLQ